MREKTWLRITDEDGDEVLIRVEQVVFVHTLKNRSTEKRTKIVLEGGNFVITSIPIDELIQGFQEPMR